MACRVAVKLAGNGGLRRQTNAADTAVKDLGMIQMRAQEDLPEITESLERAWLAKNNKVE